jgi:hypothetical protein
MFTQEGYEPGSSVTGVDEMAAVQNQIGCVVKYIHMYIC